MKRQKQTVRFHRSAIQRRNGLYGRLFLLPWTIGFVLFFAVPILQSIWYSFSSASPLDPREGSIFTYLQDTFSGLSRYRYIWNEQPDFTPNMGAAVRDFLYSLPIIVILSLVFALILKPKV